MNWLLITAVVLIGGGAFLGWRAGFVKTVFSLVSTIAVMVLTLLCSPVVTNLLKNNDTITNAVERRLEEFIDLSGLSGIVENDREPMAFIDHLELPESIKNALKDSMAENLKEKEMDLSIHMEEWLDVLEAYICESLTEVILNAIGFFITFIAASAGLAVLCFVLNIISRLPVLHQINTFAGVAFGALEGLMLLWIVFIVVTMFASTEFGQESMKLISENELLSFLYDTNILSKKLF